MKNFQHPCNKTIAVLIIAAMVGTSSGVTQAAPAAINIFAAPSNLPQFRLAPPDKLGRIVDYFNASTGEGAAKPLVILIQDLHAHYGVQKNIASLLNFLAGTLSAGPHPELGSGRAAVPFALAVEGASGPIDSSLLALYPEATIKEEASQYLMREGELSGAEYFAVKRSLPNLLVGVENDQYYNLHRELFRKTYADRAKVVSAVRDLQADIATLPRKVYSAPVKLFQKDVDAFDRGSVGIVEFASLLARRAATLQINIKKDFPALAAFADNAGTRFSPEALRAATAQFLSDGRGYFSGEEKANLSVLSKQTDSTPYYMYLRELLYQHQLFLAVTPDLAHYLEYVYTTQTAGMDQILESTHELAFHIKVALARSSEEKNLAQVQHDLDLVLRVADLQATELEVRLLAPRLNQFVVLLKSLLSAKGQRGFDEKNLRELIASSVDYYVMAMLRNEPLANNTLSLLGKGDLKLQTEPVKPPKSRSTLRLQVKEVGSPVPPQPNVAVLVAGGFHTATITQILRQRNVSYLVMSPTVDQISDADHSLYVKRLNGQLLTPEDIVAQAQENDMANKPLLDPLLPTNALATGINIKSVAGGVIATVGVLAWGTHNPALVHQAIDYFTHLGAATMIQHVMTLLPAVGMAIGSLRRSDFKDEKSRRQWSKNIDQNRRNARNDKKAARKIGDREPILLAQSTQMLSTIKQATFPLRVDHRNYGVKTLVLNQGPFVELVSRGRGRLRISSSDYADLRSAGWGKTEIFDLLGLALHSHVEVGNVSLAQLTNRAERPVYLRIAEQSSHLFEDHEANNLIFISRALVDMKHRAKLTGDSAASISADAHFASGIGHEWIHEATGRGAEIDIQLAETDRQIVRNVLRMATSPVSAETYSRTMSSILERDAFALDTLPPVIVSKPKQTSSTATKEFVVTHEDPLTQSQAIALITGNASGLEGSTAVDKIGAAIQKGFSGLPWSGSQEEILDALKKTLLEVHGVLQDHNRRFHSSRPRTGMVTLVITRPNAEDPSKTDVTTLHVGQSRIYAQFESEGSIQRLTVDDVPGVIAWKPGQIAEAQQRSNAHRSRLVNESALGAEQGLAPSWGRFQLPTGTRLILISPGIPKILGDGIEDVIRSGRIAHVSADLVGAAQQRMNSLGKETLYDTTAVEINTQRLQRWPDETKPDAVKTYQSTLGTVPPLTQPRRLRLEAGEVPTLDSQIIPYKGVLSLYQGLTTILRIESVKDYYNARPPQSTPRFYDDILYVVEDRDSHGLGLRALKIGDVVVVGTSEGKTGYRLQREGAPLTSKSARITVLAGDRILVENLSPYVQELYGDNREASYPLDVAPVADRGTNRLNVNAILGTMRLGGGLPSKTIPITGTSSSASTDPNLAAGPQNRVSHAFANQIVSDGLPRALRVDGQTRLNPKRRIFVLGHSHVSPQIMMTFMPFLHSLLGLDAELSHKYLLTYLANLRPTIDNYRHDLTLMKQLILNPANHITGIAREISEEALLDNQENDTQMLESFRQFAELSNVENPQRVAEDLYLVYYGPASFLIHHDPDVSPLGIHEIAIDDKQLKEEHYIWSETVRSTHLSLREALKNRPDGKNLYSRWDHYITELIEAKHVPPNNEIRQHLAMFTDLDIVSLAEKDIFAWIQFIEYIVKRDQAMVKLLSRNNENIISITGALHGDPILKAFPTEAVNVSRDDSADPYVQSDHFPPNDLSPALELDRLRPYVKGVSLAERVPVIPVQGLFRRTGQLGHIGLGRQYGEPVMYVDAEFGNIKKVRDHELFEIRAWNIVRILLRLDWQNVRAWMNRNPKLASFLANAFHFFAPRVAGVLRQTASHVPTNIPESAFRKNDGDSNLTAGRSNEEVSLTAPGNARNLRGQNKSRGRRDEAFNEDLRKLQGLETVFENLARQKIGTESDGSIAIVIEYDLGTRRDGYYFESLLLGRNIIVVNSHRSPEGREEAKQHEMTEIMLRQSYPSLDEPTAHVLASVIERQRAKPGELTVLDQEWLSTASRDELLGILNEPTADRTRQKAIVTSAAKFQSIDLKKAMDYETLFYNTAHAHATDYVQSLKKNVETSFLTSEVAGVAAAQDVGTKYKGEQQDAVILGENEGIVLEGLADGMGGMGNGQLASNIARYHFVRALKMGRFRKSMTTAEVKAVFQELVSEIVADLEVLVAIDPTMAGLGTTVALAVKIDGTAYVLKVGDSRVLARYPGNVIAQITKDHSRIQEILDGKVVGLSMTEADASVHELRNLLTQALAQGQPVPIIDESQDSFAVVDLSLVEQLLFMSDGVSDPVAYGAHQAQLTGANIDKNQHESPELLATILAGHESPESSVLALKEAALAYAAAHEQDKKIDQLLTGQPETGHIDNITAVAASGMALSAAEKRFILVLTKLATGALPPEEAAQLWQDSRTQSLLSLGYEFDATNAAAYLELSKTGTSKLGKAIRDIRDVLPHTDKQFDLEKFNGEVSSMIQTLNARIQSGSLDRIARHRLMVYRDPIYITVEIGQTSQRLAIYSINDVRALQPDLARNAKDADYVLVDRDKFGSEQFIVLRDGKTFDGPTIKDVASFTIKRLGNHFEISTPTQTQPVVKVASAEEWDSWGNWMARLSIEQHQTFLTDTETFERNQIISRSNAQREVLRLSMIQGPLTARRATQKDALQTREINLIVALTSARVDATLLDPATRTSASAEQVQEVIVLLKKKDALDKKIAQLKNVTGHLSEFAASQYFDTENPNSALSLLLAHKESGLLSQIAARAVKANYASESIKLKWGHSAVYEILSSADLPDELARRGGLAGNSYFLVNTANPTDFVGLPDNQTVLSGTVLPDLANINFQIGRRGSVFTIEDHSKNDSLTVEVKPKETKYPWREHLDRWQKMRQQIPKAFHDQDPDALFTNQEADDILFSTPQQFKVDKNPSGGKFFKDWDFYDRRGVAVSVEFLTAGAIGLVGALITVLAAMGLQHMAQHLPDALNHATVLFALVPGSVLAHLQTTHLFERIHQQFNPAALQDEGVHAMMKDSASFAAATAAGVAAFLLGAPALVAIFFGAVAVALAVPLIIKHDNLNQHQAYSLGPNSPINQTTLESAWNAVKALLAHIFKPVTGWYAQRKEVRQHRQDGALELAVLGSTVEQMNALLPADPSASSGILNTLLGLSGLPKLWEKTVPIRSSFMSIAIKTAA